MINDLILAAGLLYTAATVGGWIIRIVLLVGPGMVLALIIWAVLYWLDRRQARRIAADAAQAAAEAVPEGPTAEQLEAERQQMRDLAALIDAAPLMQTKPGPRDDVYHQLQALWRLPAHDRKENPR